MWKLLHYDYHGKDKKFAHLSFVYFIRIFNYKKKYFVFVLYVFIEPYPRDLNFESMLANLCGSPTFVLDAKKRLSEGPLTV